ncbi:orotidine-5'-phosphate decarboxylase [Sporosalibacterium faouarense]|uniref:orotidine-5'-phosphate decarboxylase n=1 Tax=Sporosalibacterium faouarense TaxID=516123 RepID=UPI00192BBF49|nr:orotidine-5'-phosphate decarboxylase [Sporosalibacterium faouarense]
MFVDKLIDKIIETKNPTVVGLDPRINLVPDFIKKKHFEIQEDKIVAETQAILEYNMIIIDAIKDIIPCIKPQIAFYEAYGLEGLKVFKETIEYAKEMGLMVIADIKRGDIGSTAEGYAKAYFGQGFVDVDSVTLSPYLGEDSINPFINYCDQNKGVFILAKTSNGSSGDIQDLSIRGKSVYEIMGELINKWGADYIGNHGYSSVGAVVGATYPEEMKILRKIMKKSFFLVPGYGAQGGTAEDIIHCFNEDGLGAIINSSRGIIGAHKKNENIDKYNDREFHLAIRDSAIKMRDSINNELKKSKKLAW